VVRTTNITNDTEGDDEVDVALNRTNPNNLVADWNDFLEEPRRVRCGLGSSFDGGRTWTTTILPIDFNTYGHGGVDPSIGFLSDGTALAACLGVSSDLKLSALYVARSTDGGRTWSAPKIVESYQSPRRFVDHPILTIDRYSNRVLIGYAAFDGKGEAARGYGLVSSDGGRTWSAPLEVAADYKSNNVQVQDVSLAGAPDGTIYSTAGIWQHTNERNEQEVVVSQLRPGETRFTHTVNVRKLVPVPETLPGEQWRTAPQPWIEVEPGGRVDVLLSDYVTGHVDMYLARSLDHGATWPNQVNLTSNSPGRDSALPRMSLAPSGRIDIIFYDYDEATGTMAADYGQIAAGGSTMTTTVLQSGINGNLQPPRGAGERPFIGDYIGIDSTDQTVATAWTGNGPLSQDVFSGVVTP
jgi:hypothetical protein